MASFKNSALLTLENEGGYSNNPAADYGEETYMGISRRWHPNWPGWMSIDSIKATRTIAHNEMNLVDISLVFGFYRTWFWDKLKCDSIDNQTTCNQLFDHAVTVGVEDAIKMIQVAAGSQPDGKMGPRTIADIMGKLARDKRAFNRRLFKLRTCYYLTQSDKSLVQEANLPSWIARTVKCYAG